MIKVEELEKLIEATLFMAYVKGERPLSVLTVAKPESGKTDLVLKIQRVGKVGFVTDVTAYGVINKYWNDIESGKVRHLIVPDLTVPLAKQTHTRGMFVHFLLNDGAIDCMPTWHRTYKMGQKGSLSLLGREGSASLTIRGMPSA